jgi:hypothetical protein
MLKSEHSHEAPNCGECRASCLNRKPDRAPFPAHSISKKSPREKRKSMESGNGARADAPTSGRRGAAFGITTDSNAYDPVSHHHALGAW